MLIISIETKASTETIATIETTATIASKKYLLVIGGATATGKTGVAIRLAQHYHSEILSCDSRQFYREMTIGTAKPTLAELQAAPHHFIDHLSIKDDYSVGDFEREALDVLQSLFSKNKIAILAGGSGLFIKALCEGLDEFPDVPPEVKNEVESFYKDEGIEALQKELEHSDPEYYKIVDQQNPMRLIRALSVIRASGQPFSTFRNQEKKARPFTPIYINLHWDRSELYERINKRVDLMIEAGLLEEAKNLISHKNKNALQTVGYQELFDFFEEKITLEEAIASIKQNSRRYAKRQMTWFRKDNHWKAFHPTEFQNMIDYIDSQMI